MSNITAVTDEPPMREAFLIATSAADDAAYIALHDLSALLERHESTRVIGGHMVGLVTAAFPTAGLVPRRTADADAGIPLELAASGALHDELVAMGYRALNSNRYVKTDDLNAKASDFDAAPVPTIDLLIPSYTGNFGDEKQGGRAFNTMPGLPLALSHGIRLDVTATLRNGAELSMVTTVPAIEAGIILKAYAWRDRKGEGSNKDAIDLGNLFAVLSAHEHSLLGGWGLDADSLTGSRRDAAAILHKFADVLDTRRYASTPLDTRRLALQIRRHVTLV